MWCFESKKRFASRITVTEGEDVFSTDRRPARGVMEKAEIQCFEN